MSVHLLKSLTLPQDRPLKIAVTGGIGAGKSTLVNRWEKSGIAVIRADELARKCVAPHSPILAAIIAHFGAEIAPRGQLDRAKLAQIIFSDPTEKHWVENLIHPCVARAAQEFLQAGKPAELRVYEIPLLVETRTASIYDVIITVEAPLTHRLDRLEDRGVPRDDARQRIAIQARQEQRRMVAHVQVSNEGDLEDFLGDADKVLDYLRKAIAVSAQVGG